ncbi:MAG: hypothetical protein EXR77_00155 [Myxococcales bacterium]|nr:hypothetical protein [Myxococcales bacterium]
MPQTPPNEAPLTEPAGTVRVGRSTLSGGGRWIARGFMVVLLLVAPLWQASTSVAAVVTLGILTALVWLFSVPAVPRRKPQLLTIWLWLGLAVWSLLHVVPLPFGVVAALNPLAAELHTKMSIATGLPSAAWVPLAVAPGDASLQVVVYLLAAVNSYLLANLLQSSGGKRMGRVVVQIFAATGLVAGLVFIATAPEGREILPDGVYKALTLLQIINSNHVAGYLLLCLGVTVGMAVHGGGGTRQLIYGVISIALVMLIVATGSRGGMIVVAVLLLATTATTPTPPRYMRLDPSITQSKARYRASMMAACALLALAAVGWPVFEQEFITNLELERDGKVQLFKMLPGLVAKTPILFGWGVGGIPVHVAMAGNFNVRTDFAENLVLERIANDGWLGAILFFVGLAFVAVQMLRRTDRIYAAMPFVVAPFAVLVANLVDFSIEMAGVMVPMACVCVLAEYRFKLSKRQTESVEDRCTRFHVGMMALCGLALLAVGWLLVVRVDNKLTRDMARNDLQNIKLAEVLPSLQRDFAYDAHSAYLVGRVAVEEGKPNLAVKLLDRAVALRPASTHAHLFRFAVRLQTGDVEGAGADLKWIFAHGTEVSTHALELCAISPKAEALLINVLPQMPEHALAITSYFEKTRPDIVEAVAIDLRKRYPDRRFAIEVLRAKLYLERGKILQAKEIAAGLMARPETQLDGFFVEARILIMQNKGYEAFHLYREVCEKRPAHEACGAAAWTVLGLTRPDLALEFLRKIQPQSFATPVNAARFWHWMATAHAQSDNWEEAVDAARRSYILYSGDVGAGLLLAECLFHESLFGELQELAERLHRDFSADSRVLQLVERVQTAGKPLAFAARRAAHLPGAASAAADDVSPVARP